MTQTFAAIRRGKVKPGKAGEFAKRAEAGALPVMKKMDGFKGYYLIAGADDTISPCRCLRIKRSRNRPRKP